MSPLPTSYTGVKSSEKPDFLVLPEDVYQVKILDIKLLENQPKFQSTDVEDVLKFEFVVTEAGEFNGTKLFSKNIRPMLSAGSTGYSPSTLYKIFSAVFRVSLSEEESKTVSAQNINDMIGKEVRVHVKPITSKSSGKTYNTITDYLPLKLEVAAQGIANRVDALSQKPVDPYADPKNDSDIDVDSIPF